MMDIFSHGQSKGGGLSLSESSSADTSKRCAQYYKNCYKYLTYILKIEVTSCRSVITVVHKKVLHWICQKSFHD